ncbi:hypothetical protein [Deferrisoma palaeochoriense]
MSAERWVAVGAVSSADGAGAVWERLRGLPEGVGVAFDDPGEGVHPLALAAGVLLDRPERPVVVPLVCRDRNRAALLAEARGAEALGCRGLLLLTGRLGDPGDAPVYFLDPLVLARELRRAGVGLELWATGRLSTPAQRARARALAEAGVTRWILPAGEEAVAVEGLRILRHGAEIEPLDAGP